MVNRHRVLTDDLIEILAEVVDISGIRIDINTVLGEDMPVDSRDMLRILSRIQSKYKIRFAPSDVIALKTLGDLVKTVQRLCT